MHRLTYLHAGREGEQVLGIPYHTVDYGPFLPKVAILTTCVSQVMLTNCDDVPVTVDASLRGGDSEGPFPPPRTHTPHENYYTPGSY